MATDVQESTATTQAPENPAETPAKPKAAKPGAPPPRQLGLQQAILAVMAECKYLIKDRPKETGQNAPKYSMKTEEGVLELLHDSLVKHGITMWPIKKVVLKSEKFNVGSGKEWRFIQMECTFTMKHTSGEERQVVAIGEGTDPGDKASYKAQTGAKKYALLEAFLVESGDDPDKYASQENMIPDEPPQRSAPPASQPTQQAPPPAGNGRAGGGQYSQRFYLRNKAVRQAESLAELEDFRKKYTTDGKNSEEEIRLMDESYAKRKKELEAEAAGPAAAPPAGGDAGGEEHYGM